MRRNTLIVLLALVAALAGTFAWLQRERAAEVPALPAAERWLPELDSATLSGLHMQFADGSPDIRVERRAGAWVLPAKADYPADRLRLSALLEALAEARKVEAKSANPKNHALLGLAERGEGQALRLSLHWQSDEPLVLLVGKDAQHGGSFVRRLGDPQAWLIDKRLPLPNNELEWLDRRIATLPFARVRELQLRYPKGERLDLYRDDAGQPNLQVRQLPTGRKLAYEAAANGAAALFADLRFADVAPLAQVGFRQAPLLLAFSLRTFSGARLDGEIRRQGEQYWLLPKSVEASPRARSPPILTGPIGSKRTATAPWPGTCRNCWRAERAQPAVWPASSRMRCSTAFRPLLREGDSWRERPRQVNQSLRSRRASSRLSMPSTRASSTASRPRIRRASLSARKRQWPSRCSPSSQTRLSQPCTRCSSWRSCSASGARRSPHCSSRRARCSQLAV